MTKRHYGQFCGLAHALELVGERWALLIVRRRVLPRPDGSVVYELTDYGTELEDVVLRLGLWGARSLGQPRPDDVLTTDSVIMALRSTFRPDHADGLEASYELRLGEVVVHARVDDGTLDAAEGPADEPDLVIETGPALRALLAGELSPAEAVADGSVHLSGDPALLARFVEVFQIPPPPSG